MDKNTLEGKIVKLAEDVMEFMAKVNSLKSAPAYEFALQSSFALWQSQADELIMRAAKLLPYVEADSDYARGLLYEIQECSSAKVEIALKLQEVSSYKTAQAA